jgi:hypothetical protein
MSDTETPASPSFMDAMSWHFRVTFAAVQALMPSAGILLLSYDREDPSKVDFIGSHGYDTMLEVLDHARSNVQKAKREQRDDFAPKSDPE